jgi:predicted metal-binding protein
MNKPVAETLHAALATRAELMRHHDPERVQGYCRSCEKYGRFWSCPPFAVLPLDGFPEWTHAVIVCQRTPIAPGTTKEQLVERFLAARVSFGGQMRRLEARFPRVTALVAGHCSGCADCTRSEGNPCRASDRLRYSLEAVGFDVTGLAEGLAGVKIHWPRSGLPDYLTTVGALLCDGETVATALCDGALAENAQA